MGGFTLIYSFSSASQLKKPSYATWISMFDGQPPETPELLMLPQDQTPIIEKKRGGKWREQKSCPEFNEVSAPRHLQKAQTIDNGWSVDWWWIKTSRGQMVMG
jgi:hypothetical protein